MTSLPACSHRPPCPGCPRYGASGAPGTALALLAALCERAGLRAPTSVAGAPQGFRHRARLSIRGRVENPKIGIFEAGTHRVVHIPNCRVHHPLVNATAAIVRRALIDHAISPYSDGQHAGRARALQVVVERASGRAQVVLVTNDAAPVGLEALFADIARALGERLHSLWWNGNPERVNTVLGPHWQKLSGPDAIVESFGGTAVYYPPGAFGQSNLGVAEKLLARVGELVPAGLRVLELYAGTGPIGLSLAARAARLELNELGSDSLDGLRRGIDALPGDLARRVSVHPGPAASVAHRIAESDVVIVDPPRKGLDRPVLDALLAAPPRRLVYASCGLGSFLAEAEELMASSRLRLQMLEIFELFPFTEHVEVLAMFEASENPKG